MNPNEVTTKFCWHKWGGLTIQIGLGAVVGKQCEKCGKLSKRLRDLQKTLNEQTNPN